MHKLAIIPARGGSKRIPKKNIKDFLGKPIISYSIQAALNSGLFDEVMVSTDDEEIATIALQYGAKVPFLRSMDNANDHATTIAVLKEVEAEYKSRYNQH
ncbi:cytidylyltransferase domain-containing protein, partial [Arcticibacter sp.]|uniref:cytidylyltransferase domain-containing protein n=1 Tax=Arcticibacter sp. TaxID=1872630 RepID=UPI0038900FC3